MLIPILVLVLVLIILSVYLYTLQPKNNEAFKTGEDADDDDEAGDERTLDCNYSKINDKINKLNKQVGSINNKISENTKNISAMQEQLGKKTAS